MQSKWVLNGIFRVTEDGSIYKRTTTGDEIAKTCGVSRRKKYLMVSTYEGGEQKHFYVHRLVAEAFIPNHGGLPQINHIDGNPRNNAVSNLEWCTVSRNISHAYATGLYKTNFCTVCGRQRFSRENSTMCGPCKKELARKKIVASTRSDACRFFLSASTNPNLTNTEASVAKMLANGCTQKEAAMTRGVSKQAISLIVRFIKRKILQEATKQ